MTDRFDASTLKPYGFGYDSPVWWGQICMAAMELTMILLLVASYLYERTLFAAWPPPGTDTQGLLLPTLNLLLLGTSTIPMHIADKAVLKCEWRTTMIGMVVCILMGIAALALQVYIWSRFNFSWHSGVYGSLIWILMGLHTAHVVAALLETIVITALPFLGYKSDQVRKALNVDEIYWYFVVVSAVPVYGVVFYAPRIL
jgi:cytochrome c oxidase subunit III